MQNMKSRILVSVKRLLCTVLFLALVVGMLSFMEGVLRVKSPSVPNMHEEYMNLPENSLDVVFLGSSHNYYTVSPVAIWEKSGISSFVLGGPSLRLNVAAEILKEALKTQSPKVVFVECFSLSYRTPQTTQYLHYTYDSWPLSWDKFQSVRRVAQDNEAVKELMFPLMTYHSRWNEVEAEEVMDYLETNETFAAKGHVINYYKSKDVVLDGSLFSYKAKQIAETEQAALAEIKQLCQSKGIRLELWAAPSGNFNDRLGQNIQEIADAQDLTFLNLNEQNYLDELGIDVAEHFCDTSHVNEYGAEIVSAYLAGYLQEMGLVASQDASLIADWEEYCKEYHHRKQERILRGQHSAENFLSALTYLQNCTVLFVENGAMTDIRPYNQEMLEELGLAAEIRDTTGNFVAIMNAEGIVEMKSAKKETAKLKWEFGKDSFVLQVAEGKKTIGNITHNGKKLLPKKNGLGIVVYDNLQQEVLTSVVLPLNKKGNSVVRAET